MFEDQAQDHSKQITIALNALDSFKDNNLEDFVTPKSMTLTQMMGLPDGFLNIDPDLWGEGGDWSDYRQVAETVESLQVVNYGTTLNTEWHEYSGITTCDEMQLYFSAASCPVPNMPW